MKRLALIAAVAATPALAEDVTYDVDGVGHTGYFAKAENAKGLVLIMHDWDGMTDYERQRADMLAELGYDAFALDLFGEDTPAETMDHRQAATGELYQNREKMRMLIQAGLDQAKSLSDAEAIVVKGYCFGGAAVLEMARSDMASEAAGFATFHGGLGTPEGQGWDGDEPPIMVFHGASDSVIPMEDVATFTNELTEAGGDFRIEVYSGAPHAFTVFGSDSYREEADMESWEAFKTFLSQRTGA